MSPLRVWTNGLFVSSLSTCCYCYHLIIPWRLLTHFIEWYAYDLLSCWHKFSIPGTPFVTFDEFSVLVYYIHSNWAGRARPDTQVADLRICCVCVYNWLDIGSIWYYNWSTACANVSSFCYVWPFPGGLFDTLDQPSTLIYSPFVPFQHSRAPFNMKIVPQPTLPTLPPAAPGCQTCRPASSHRGEEGGRKERGGGEEEGEEEKAEGEEGESFPDFSVLNVISLLFCQCILSLFAAWTRHHYLAGNCLPRDKEFRMSARSDALTLLESWFVSRLRLGIVLIRAKKLGKCPILHLFWT